MKKLSKKYLQLINLAENAQSRKDTLFFLNEASRIKSEFKLTNFS
tara:strand:+ start:430 stop:564 length:135 start_codon:yes stop_codon:yes gene_type:complete